MNYSPCLLTRSIFLNKYKGQIVSISIQLNGNTLRHRTAHLQNHRDGITAYQVKYMGRWHRVFCSVGTGPLYHYIKTKVNGTFSDVGIVINREGC